MATRSNVFLFIIVIVHASARSYNRPQLCAKSTWNPSGTTLMNNATLSLRPRAIAVDDEDNLYVLEHGGHQLFVQTSRNRSTILNMTIGPVFTYSGFFLSPAKEIYFEDGQQTGSIVKRSLNTSSTAVVTRFTHHCYGLFIDQNDTLYCSLHHEHRIVTMSLADNSSVNVTRAGNGSRGNTSMQLAFPWGIFVDTNYDLYVADPENNRVQFFLRGSLNGTTVAGLNIPQSLSLNYPTDVILDLDGHLYIADNGNNRIIRVTTRHFQCLVGCSGIGSASHQMNHAFSVRFDSQGNLIAADEWNHRIQKFMLTFNCEQFPYYRQKLCSNATWNDTGIMVLSNVTGGPSPRGIAIDINNTLYYADYHQQRILYWPDGSLGHNASVIASISLSESTPLFVAADEDIYASAWSPPGAVTRTLIHNATQFNVTMFNDHCYGLFLDIDSTLYCSLHLQHRIDAISLKNTSTQPVTRAGNATNGSASNQLSKPWGIFVDIELTLFVADYNNDRIQRFPPNASDAITVAGQGIPNGLLLNRPTDVVIDGYNQLYIADKGNHRIVRVTSSDYRCIVGCCCGSGSAANQINQPHSLRFDSFGNLYVSDEGNARLQKFVLLSNCNEMLGAFLPNTLTTIGPSMHTTTNTIPSTALSFFPQVCSNVTHIGSFCNITNDPCRLLTPCLNGGSCVATNQSGRGYRCLCLSGFNGTDCQLDQRPCPSNLCLNNGTCQVLFNGTEACQCAQGWRGDRCEKRVDFCQNITCENQGVCRSLVIDYRCECLGDSYEGRHCEIESRKTVILNAVARSMAYIAIVFMIGTALFIVTMDVLKYFFGIDPVSKCKKKSKKTKPKRKRRRPPVVPHVRIEIVSDPSGSI